MNARVGAFGSGFRRLRRSEQPGTWLAGQVIRIAVVLMFAAIPIALIVVVLVRGFLISN
jgi:hypothetical protein